MNSTLKPVVIARLTVCRTNGTRTIVEIHADASFHSFYRFYQQQGARRSTKTLLRMASRNESLPVINTHLYTPGLDVIRKRLESFAAQSNPVVKVILRIIKRRAYKRLITAGAHELGPLPTVGASPKKHARTLYPVVIGKAIPVGKWLKSLEVRP